MSLVEAQTVPSGLDIDAETVVKGAKRLAQAWLNPTDDAVALGKQNKPKRPSVESLFENFNQRGTTVITAGNPEREIPAKILEAREINPDREWQEPATRIEGKLSLDF